MSAVLSRPAPMLIWGNRKHIRQQDRAVRQARQHQALTGRPLLARGVCSLVFDAGDTVLKLTVDGLNYNWAAQQAKWCCPGLPGTVALHGQVGVSETGAPLWLFEQERLARLRTGSDARKRAMHVGRMLRDNYDRLEWADEILQDIIPRVHDVALAEAVGLLAGFASHHRESVALDLHASNFMLREATGQVVICDPFVDMTARHLAQQHSLQLSGLPANTVFI